MTNHRILLGLILCLSPTVETRVVADDFRIDSMVFRHGQEDAICQNTTILIGDKSYDQLHGPQIEVTIVDMEAAQVMLLDPSRKRRTEIHFEQLANFVRTVSARAAKSRAHVRFAARPDFKIEFETEKRLLTLIGEEMEYRVETVTAPNATAAAQFRNFADWTARLNTVRPSLPPAARLELNQQLYAHRHLPTEISRTVSLPGGKPQRLTSRHGYTWTLSADDRATAARFDVWANEFENVELHTFLSSQE